MSICDCAPSCGLEFTQEEAPGPAVPAVRSWGLSQQGGESGVGAGAGWAAGLVGGTLKKESFRCSPTPSQLHAQVPRESVRDHGCSQGECLPAEETDAVIKLRAIGGQEGDRLLGEAARLWDSHTWVFLRCLTSTHHSWVLV